jgi:hypothetical protein
MEAIVPKEGSTITNHIGPSARYADIDWISAFFSVYFSKDNPKQFTFKRQGQPFTLEICDLFSSLSGGDWKF